MGVKMLFFHKSLLYHKKRDIKPLRFDIPFPALLKILLLNRSGYLHAASVFIIPFYNRTLLPYRASSFRIQT